MADKKCMISTCNSTASDKIITCSGVCNKFVHPGCIKINNTAFPLFATKNIKWFCDDCCCIFEKLSQNMVVVLDTIQSIAADVKSIIKSDVPGPSTERRITRLAKKNGQPSDSAGSAPTSNLADLPLPINKSNNLLIGSCVDSDDAIGLKAVPERKYVYVSRLACTTTAESILTYLNKKLQIPEADLDCRILVAANRDVSKFSFVSFKIGVSPNVFDKLLQPDVWPVGVMIREFIDRPKNYQMPVSLV